MIRRRQPASGAALESVERVLLGVRELLASPRVQRLLSVVVFVAAFLYLLRSLEPSFAPEVAPDSSAAGPVVVAWSGSWSAVSEREELEWLAQAQVADPVPAREPVPDPRAPDPEPPADPPVPRLDHIEVEVLEGDSLWRLARRHLGQGYLWPRIAAANPDVDPDRLRVGALLRVPVAASPGHGAVPAPRGCVEPGVHPAYTESRAGFSAQLSPGTVRGHERGAQRGKGST